MKSLMNVKTDIQKKKKNRKGFSLVELIVVLVIMAILVAALVPSLIGYIKKTKEQNVQSECQSAVTASQTIASGAYAASDGKYKVGSNEVVFSTIATGTALTTTTDAYQKAIKELAEVPGTVVSVTVDASGFVKDLIYQASSGSTATHYQRADLNSAGTYTNGTVSGTTFTAG